MELSIDTASEMASVALSDEGVVMAEATWRCRRNHTVELLPAIDRLLTHSAAERSELSAVFVCSGPGQYSGLRVGISVAQGVASGLGLPALGVGRLELDAYGHAAFPGPIVAVHRAGRGDLAWASYSECPWRELSSPRLSSPGELAAAVLGPTLFVGEVDDELAALLVSATEGRAVVAAGTASIRRAGWLAELGWSRLQAGAQAEAALLRPIYLRPPAIDPPTKPDGL